jgi:uncharacterized protein (DUF885 family)
MDVAAHFREVAAAAVDEFLLSNPEVATYLGDHRSDDELTDRSDAGMKASADNARAHLDALDGIDASQLDPQDAVDHGMLTTAMRQRVFSYDELAEHRWNPLVYNLGEALYPLVARAERPAEVRLQALAGRLARIPDVLASARSQLDNPPLVHVETAIGQNAGALHLVDVEVPALLAEVPSLRTTVEPARQLAHDALTAHTSFLQSLLEEARGDFRIGAGRFATKLALALDSDIAPEVVVQRAKDNVAQITEELYALSRESYGARTTDDCTERRAAIKTMLDGIGEDRPDDATIVGRAEVALDEATAFVRDHDLVTLLEGERTEIQEMPAFRRGVAVAYCDAPGPLEDAGVTFFAIAPTPDDWSAQRKESFYREYNNALVRNLTVHEAMPGHMLQLAHARRFSGSTQVRKVFRSGSFIEGWAVHAERIMVELGFGGRAVQAQRLKMQLRMSINAILDASVHAGDMTEAEAMRLMTVDGFQEEGEAAGKWRRACLSSSQLSTYFVGYAELADLLARRPRDLSDKQAYDALLSHGNPSPRRLAQLLAW